MKKEEEGARELVPVKRKEKEKELEAEVHDKDPRSLPDDWWRREQDKWRRWNPRKSLSDRINDFVQKKYGEHRSVSEGTEVERLAEARDELKRAGHIPPDSGKTNWNTFLGGRAADRGPKSEPSKGNYYVGPRGGTSKRTHDVWRPIVRRGGVAYYKSDDEMTPEERQEHNEKVVGQQERNRDIAMDNKKSPKQVSKAIDAFIEKQSGRK